jgi:hypothetical protein
VSEPIDITCAATQRCSHQPAPGLLVCRGHLERLGAMLRDIEDEAAILSAVPSMQQQQGRGGGLASHRTPVRLDVLVHTDPRHGTGKSEDYDDALAAGETLSILATLHSWARVIREDRALTDPGTVTISGERDTLSRHLDYAVAQPWCDEFYGDIVALVGQLKAANGHKPDRPLTRCVIATVDGLCGGNVWIQDVAQLVTYANGWQHVEMVPDGPAVCDRCGGRWEEPEDKVRLKLMIEQEHDERTRPRTDDGRRMLTAQELVDHGYVSSVSNVRVQVHRQGRASIEGHYDPEWFGKVSA